MSKNEKQLEGLARGFRGRTLKTMRLIGKAGLKALGKTMRPDARAASPDDEVIAERAESLLSQMNELKGLMMKFGQMASYLEGSLPPAAQRVLSRLQQESTPLEYAAIAEVVRESLGDDPEVLFESFDPEPFAAASIGQVHRATYSGREVAVKVQYPGIEAALGSDLKILGLATRLSALVSPGMDAKSLIRELRERMLAECDYEQEGQNQALFARLLADIEGAAVPAVIDERTGRRVLTSELVSGRTFYPFCEELPQAIVDRAAATIFEACYRCLFQRAVFNADPHPGNYVFGDSGGVTFLDFGCVKHFSADFIDGWKRLAMSILDNDRAAFRDAFTESFDIRRPKRMDWDYQWDVVEYLYRPFKQAEPFTYTHDYVARSYDLMVWKNPDKMRMGMPAEWLLVNRLQWGLNSVLAHMKATGPWPEIYRAAVTSPTTTVEIEASAAQSAAKTTTLPSCEAVSSTARPASTVMGPSV